MDSVSLDDDGDEEEDDDEEEEDDGGEDEMSGGGPAGDIPNDEAGGKGDGTGAAAGQNTKNTGAKGSGELNQQIPIRFRSFASGGNVDEYTITIHPQIADPTEAKIALYTVGDDQKGDANIKRAIKNDGTIIEIKGGVIGPITLTPNTAAILKITLSQSMRVAMEVIAYEA